MILLGICNERKRSGVARRQLQSDTLPSSRNRSASKKSPVAVSEDRKKKTHTNRKEIPHHPLENRAQQQQHRPNKEENPRDTTQTRRTAPAHHHHGEAESRDDKADKAHGRRIGEAFVGIADVRDLGSEVEFLKELGGEGDVCGSVVEGG
jgi:flagellum-specific peptidoglycan hydrolase FlgJ